jgi:NTP pyrophosphatase (non-canonical NTP hydrolase)
VLGSMTEEVMNNNIEKGWYETDRTFGDDVALLHSEVSEALEAFRSWGFEDATADREPGSWEDSTQGPPKPEGVGAELADVFIRLLDTCGRRNVNLVAEYERKMSYNRTRPYRHGGIAL